MNFDRFCLSSVLFCFLFAVGIFHGKMLNAQDTIALEEWGESHDGPIGMVPLPDSNFILIQKQGLVKLLDDDGNHLGDILDISGHIGDSGGERGLLGVALHPSYPDSPYLYLNHTDELDNTAIVRYALYPDSMQIDTASRKLLLTVEQPYGNHNGGHLAFGPDDYLYIGMGDGGSGGDPENRAQNLNTLLGKILRIDVDSGDPYGIPENNPFVDSTDAMPEIWSYGWRNPWRFSFDRETGDMWVGDVGQGDVEEVSLELRDTVGGLNYGWRCYEGDQEYDTSEDCEGPFVDPILTRDHTTGDASITGGYRYRGPDTSLQGHYIFGDFVSGNVYMAVLSELDTPTVDTLMTIGAIPSLASFAEDDDGSLYALSLNGQIYKIGMGDDLIDCDTLPVPELVIMDNESDSSVLVTDSTYVQYVWYYSETSDQIDAFMAIDTTSEHVFYPEEGGNYYVEVVDSNGCPGFSEIVQVVLSNAVSALEFYDIQVFPNPVTNFLTIRTEEMLPQARIEIINSQGRLIRQMQSQLPGTVSMHNLPAGMYFVKFVTQEKYHVAKIFKE